MVQFLLGGFHESLDEYTAHLERKRVSEGVEGVVEIGTDTQSRYGGRCEVVCGAGGQLKSTEQADRPSRRHRSSMVQRRSR